jgi:pSer/pThr/pTyr-binding forkhead associated (FHA) protein
MENQNEEAPLLVAGAGPLNGQRWAIRKTTVLGREATCDIVIPDRQVSRQHARLSQTKQGILLEDLSSKNGTHFNGAPLAKSVLLQDGDLVQIALAQQFTFLSSDATLPLDSEEPEPQMAPPQAEILRLEKRSRRVWIGKQEVLPPLSVSQFKLLELLYENQGRVVPREEMIKIIWGDDQAVMISEQALDALVRRLRDRLAAIDSTHTYIATVRGHGLRLDNPAQG